MTQDFTLWVDNSANDDKQFIIDWHMEARPSKIMTCGLVTPLPNNKEKWDLALSDDLHVAVPEAEVRFRPYKPDIENEQGEDGEAYIKYVQQQLEGRDYRICFGNEPDVGGQNLIDFLRRAVNVMNAAHKYNQKIAVAGFQANGIPYYNRSGMYPNALDGGWWHEFLYTAGELSALGIVEIDYDSYCPFFIPCGLGNPFWMQQVISNPDLLRKRSEWASPEYVLQHPFDNRHLFRERWLNKYVREETLFKEHNFFIREWGVDSRAMEGNPNEESVAREHMLALGINGGTVNGFATIRRLTEWKFQKDAEESITEQTEYYMDCARLDPHFTGAAGYCASTMKSQAKQDYNLLVYKKYLANMAAYNKKMRQQPTDGNQHPPQETPKPIHISQLLPVTPNTGSAGLNVRSAPGSGEIVNKILPTQTAFILKSEEDKLGVQGDWVKIYGLGPDLSIGHFLGYSAAWLLMKVPVTQPAPIPSGMTPEQKAVVQQAIDLLKGLIDE